MTIRLSFFFPVAYEKKFNCQENINFEQKHVKQILPEGYTHEGGVFILIGLTF